MFDLPSVQKETGTVSENAYRSVDKIIKLYNFSVTMENNTALIARHNSRIIGNYLQ